MNLLQNLIRFFKLTLFSFIFISCSTSIKDYKEMKPELNFERFFNGKLIAHGFFKDRFNFVKKTFVVKMDASWKDGVCTLKEDFLYNDGTKSQRTWIISKVDNKYIGKASDVIGEASGEISGNTLYWNYYLNLEVDKKNYKVKFDDWMYLVDDKTLLNQSYMTKFGIDLGQVVLSIKKED